MNREDSQPGLNKQAQAMAARTSEKGSATMNAASERRDLLRILAVQAEASVHGSSPHKADLQRPLDKHLSILHYRVRTVLSSPT
jgi:hypothetical protein